MTTKPGSVPAVIRNQLHVWPVCTRAGTIAIVIASTGSAPKMLERMEFGVLAKVVSGSSSVIERHANIKPRFHRADSA